MRLPIPHRRSQPEGSRDSRLKATLHPEPIRIIGPTLRAPGAIPPPPPPCQGGPYGMGGDGTMVQRSLNGAGMVQQGRSAKREQLSWSRCGRPPTRVVPAAVIDDDDDSAPGFEAVLRAAEEADRGDEYIDAGNFDEVGDDDSEREAAAALLEQMRA
eukprot:gene23202-biopygen2821